jgi:hypothetical protein
MLAMAELSQIQVNCKPKETVARGIKSLVPETGQLQADSQWTVSGSFESLFFFSFFSALSDQSSIFSNMMFDLPRDMSL